MTQLSRNNRIKLVCIAVIAWVAIVAIFSSGPGAAITKGSGKVTADSSKPQKKDRKSDPKSAGCLSCHEGSESMHHGTSDFELGIGCVDCHGGNPEPAISPGDTLGSASYNQVKYKAHVAPRYPELWGKAKEPYSSANPVRTNTLILRESPEFVRFMNPGDLRAAQISCGTANCHPQEVYAAKKSLMAHGAMLWGTILYNNGTYPYKDSHYGQSYSIDGRNQRLQTIPPPTEEETRKKGVVAFLNPLPRYEMTQPTATNVFRVFERGGEGKLGVLLPSDVGSPDPDDDPGKPDVKLAARGYGTGTRTDPVYQGLTKTRLLDPTMIMLGTNDQPGDFRSSGCSGCHVVYANDRDPIHSAAFSKFGNMGMSTTEDATIPKNESGHPVKHQMTNGIPSSQCMICHIHPGTSMIVSYYGMLWWDNETDGEHMYPTDGRKLSPEQEENIRLRNPEGSAVRGLWGQDMSFLDEVWKEVNPKLRHTQFGDFHGHGWVYRNVYKQDSKGNLLDDKGNIVSFDDPEKFKKAVHLQDIHLEKGMHCVDCHFRNDSHGNGNLYVAPRDPVEVDCIDCHGTIYAKANLITSGQAAGQGRYNGKVINKAGFKLSSIRTPFGKKLFEMDKKTGDIYQNSMVTKDLKWRVVQTLDSIDPKSPDYKEKSALAKTMRRDGKTWGDLPADPKAEADELAHSNTKMTCYACHTSWTTSCFGCHLSMEANKQKPILHFEDKSKQHLPSRDTFRNWTAYNYQTLRNDIYFLGIDGTVTGHRIAPARSACAILVSSQNALRDWIYAQQQSVSAEGFSGQAFSTYFPHTVRATETKQCTDCHRSKAEDNNAWMAQVLMQGTNFVNFMFRYVYVATGHHGFEGIAVTEHTEPQAVLGSKLQELAYPAHFKKLKKSPHGEGFEPKAEKFEHRANGSEIRSLQLRSEYLYTANGTGGFRIYDVSLVDNKDFSERFTTAPISPLGQKFYIRSKDATSITSPATMLVDPTRKHFPENEEGSAHLLYAFLYGTDSEEGFVVIGPIGTLIDGEARNNFVDKAKHVFNPDGKLKGAMNVTIAGTYAYVSTTHGLVVIDINDPTKPEITAEIGEPFLKNPHAVAVQYRFAFVTDEEGVKVLDLANLAKPKPVENAVVRLAEAHNIYVARTYAYVAAGKEGLAIIDVTKPKEPKLDQTYNAEGEINDTHDVKVGMVINSAYAFLADGKNGLRVVELIGPDQNDDVYGWSPRPKPKLIATYETEGEALAISKGLDRDRAMDESGNQLAVFGRRGAHPLDKPLLKTVSSITVTNDPPRKPKEFKRPPEQKASIDPRNLLEAGEGFYSDKSAKSSEVAGNYASSSIPLVSFALIFLPLAVLLSRQRNRR